MVEEFRPRIKPRTRFTSIEKEILKTHPYVPSDEIYHLTAAPEEILESNRMKRVTYRLGSLSANPNIKEYVGMGEVTHAEKSKKEWVKMVFDFKKLWEDYSEYLFPVYYLRSERQRFKRTILYTKLESYYLDIVHRMTKEELFKPYLGEREGLISSIEDVAAPFFLDKEDYSFECEWKYCRDIKPVDKYFIRIESASD